ncbi:helix-turn-helix domain-containing protein [Streptomyces albireticuli]|uniref:Transcriptional regulator n=1 Tax=Streptomyces albireticuli TaxID=1940 RepID=A0A2A2D756_9ACTN|nr:helix-turn-helix transcriptional regulator [Streptomyces albireticuli]MCD9141831.1 helix-turn-helix domain-containing protein [Streptomyces albireticuli]MCD9163225.1 helix-turn-helix domain-containing protein [Streptomyces albireticuli]MCD9190004.1 helix-turn-helix domain-containing protein [Streptomyces albireticuli]PAU47345.1 transcriptional regulator [Streptomyces albireticuli]
MPPRSNPTARQVRLGSELRKLREASGMPAKEAGALLGGGSAQISHIEAGRWGVSADRVRHMAKLYSCDDAVLIAALCAITEERRGQHWWDAYRGVLAQRFMDIAELEHHAIHLRYLQSVTFPGLMQVEGYARALFGSAVPGLSVDELEARVEHRLRRRIVLTCDSPPRLDAIIHEAALRMRIGGRKVAQEQLDHVLEISQQPGVVVRVIPFTHESFVDVSQTALYAFGVVPQLDTVQVDTPLGGRYLDAVTDLDSYRKRLDLVLQSSLSPAESRAFIHRIAREL